MIDDVHNESNALIDTIDSTQYDKEMYDIVGNYLQMVRSIGHTVNIADLSQIPHIVLREYYEILVTTKNSIINFFKIVANNKRQKHDTSNFENSMKHFFTSSTQFLLQLSLLNSSIDLKFNIVAEVKKILEEVKEYKLDVVGYEENAGSIVSKLEDVLANAKNKATEIAIAKFGTTFHKQAERHKESARKWMYATIVLLCSIVLVAVGLLAVEPELKINASSVIVISTRVIVFTALFIGITMAIRNYKAEKHNQLVNEHRQNALNTFDTFINSTVDNDAGTKNAILLEATRTIFSNQSTAYSTASDSDDSHSKVIEIFKSVTNSKT